MYFTLRKAQSLTRENPKHMPNSQLQKHLVRLLDFKRYLDYSNVYMEKLVEGDYFARVMDASATGLVPKDMWLHSNITLALDEAIKEKQIRLDK